MIWCRTALKLGGIIGGLAQYRKPYLIFSVTKRNYWLFFALICFIFRQLTKNLSIYSICLSIRQTE